MNNLFQIATWSILIYALVVLLGGVMGYLKAKSKASLFSGVGSGDSVACCLVVCRQIPIAGLGLATLIGLVLFVVFVIRFSPYSCLHACWVDDGFFSRRYGCIFTRFACKWRRPNLDNHLLINCLAVNDA
jgi:uncharacterized membrane protein (UPF0136 family)